LRAPLIRFLDRLEEVKLRIQAAYRGRFLSADILHLLVLPAIPFLSLNELLSAQEQLLMFRPGVLNIPPALTDHV
jgi:hypothetical protein